MFLTSVAAMGFGFSVSNTDGMHEEVVLPDLSVIFGEIYGLLPVLTVFDVLGPCFGVYR